MPNPIYPGALWVGGRNDGYASGRSSMRAVVCHYTVGRDSSAIGRDGYFHWLVSRDGRIEQYAEADAITWHAGEANGVGPGIEIEFLDEPEGVFTDAARDACSGLIHWLSNEYGIELSYYDGDRIPPSSMVAYVAHRSIQQSEGHSDSWPRADWDRMVAGGGEDDVKALIIKNRSQPFLYVFVDGYKYPTANREHVDLMYFFGQSSNGADNPAEISDEQFNAIPDLADLT